MKDQRQNALIIEHQGHVREALRHLLVYKGYEVMLAGSHEYGWHQALHAQPDLIVLDWDIPNSQSADILSRIKRDDRTADIPVLMVSVKKSANDVYALSSFTETDFLPQDSVAIAQVMKKLVPNKSSCS